jgi:L(+)-tartrate dehydratase beta subunit
VSALREHRIGAPASDEELAGLAIGDVVTIDGVIYTGREGVYKRLIDEGAPPPFDLAALTNVNFHCSPAAAVDDDGSYRIGAVTATASFRFARWMKPWFALSGARVIIGKGGMPEDDYRRDFVPAGAVYLTTVGYGTGALLGRGVKRVRAVHWLEELGIAQALWVFEVESFGPFLVESDLAGNSLFARENAALDRRVGALYEGLREPAMKRFGETTKRDDELI